MIYSPDEIKLSYSEIEPVTAEAILSLLKLPSLNDKQAEMVITTANVFLTIVTKHKFDLSQIQLHLNTPAEEIRRITLSSKSKSGIIVENEKRIPIKSREGRNNELSAMTIEKTVYTLLENSMEKAGVPIKISKNPPGLTSSEIRAAKIVSKAFKNKGWKLPSMKNIKENK
jgi:hypothetical protein